jgi:hypothetical protein
MSVTEAVEPIPKIWSQAERVTGWGMGLSGFKVESESVLNEVTRVMMNGAMKTRAKNTSTT